MSAQRFEQYIRISSTGLKLCFVLSCAVVAFLVSITPAAAQEDRTIDEIVVTGSNIRRRQDFETPSPVQTIGEAEIADTGAARIQDIFKGITANSGSQLANRQNELQGLSQFSLRGLGVGSTLTLINGRRAGLAPATDSSGQLFTDINQFPVNMIERIEVLTDGASSTYGSEAVAGVVNIFTRTDFEGLELTLEARTSTHDAFQAGIAFGKSFDEGHFTLFANFAEQGGNTRKDFDFIANGNQLADGAAGIFDSGTGSPGRFNRAVTDGSGGFLRTGNTLADPDCVAAGGILDGANCRYHFLNQRRIIAEETRAAVFTQFEFDASDKLEIFGEASFSRNEIRDGIGGLLFRVFSDDGGWYVPASHPFNFFVDDGAGGITYAGPNAFAADPTLQAVDLIYRGRALGADADGGNLADAETVFTNIRYVAGLDYDFDGNWLLHTNFVYSNSDYTRRQPRDWEVSTFAAQIEAGNWNPFGTRLANPDLVSPKDGVSVAGNDVTVFNTFALSKNDQRRVEQTVLEVILSGETGLALGGGKAAMAVGAQYRDLSLDDLPDGRYQSGNNRLNETIPAVFGTQDVYAVFGEVSLPFLDTLVVDASIRFEDYGNQGGDTTDPKVSAKFDFNDNWFVRGSWGSSFQAPSIRQIAGVVSTATINDPAAINEAFIVTVVTQGSPSLTSQSAENINVGLVYRTDAGLDVSIDYWTYDYEDLILPGADPQFIFDQVFLGNLPPERALRGPDGQPASVIAEFENQGDATASGLDFVGHYNMELASGAILTFNVGSTVITEYDSSEFGDIKGSRNFSNGFGSTPDLKLNGGVTWSQGDHLVNLSARHIGSYNDDQTSETVDSQTTVDVRYQLVLDGFLGGETTTLGIGITNILDEDPPALNARPLFDTEVHDPRGRQVYLTLKHGF
jgi:iron complex outermembrane receptor protein